MDLIKMVVDKEWDQFQLVNSGSGCKTDCQQDPEQFRIMRTSQFMTWPEEILESYYADLCEAEAQNRNLLFEKYAWMMASTNPKAFDEIKYYLPEISEERWERICVAAKVQAVWAEEFADRYPAFAGRGRVFYSKDDTLFQTSVETYGAGELASYSEKTEKMFSEFVCRCCEEEHNLLMDVRENMAKAYGYNSLDEAEEYMKNRR